MIVINTQIIRAVNGGVILLHVVIVFCLTQIIRAVNGGVIRALGELPLRMGLGSQIFEHDFLVLPNVTNPLIIGEENHIVFYRMKQKEPVGYYY